MTSSLWRILFITILIASPLSSQTNHFSAPQRDESAILLATDSLFSILSAEKGAGTAFLTYMDDSASLFPAGENIITGKDNIKKHFADPSPNTSLTWTPLKADISASGDLGYTYGVYVYKYPDDNGHPVYRNGKYITVWKKQSDGSWKFILDIGNTSPLPPQK